MDHAERAGVVGDGLTQGGVVDDHRGGLDPGLAAQAPADPRSPLLRQSRGWVAPIAGSGETPPCSGSWWNVDQSSWAAVTVEADGPSLTKVKEVRPITQNAVATARRRRLLGGR